MQALNHKLLRDLWRIKGQAFAISMVIGVGITTLNAYLGAFAAMNDARDKYYEHQRFAHVFASLKRAPLSLAGRIADIPGVAEAQTRVVVDVTLDVEDMEEPATGRLVSIPNRPRRTLNDVTIIEGRYIDASRPDEVIISESFASGHDMHPGATVRAILNGRSRVLEVVGVARSPEYIYTIRPGELIPDDKRFGVLWMERRALAAAFNMEGGFNDVALLLMPGANTDEVIQDLDSLLEPYGGWGAIPRDLQLSHWSIDNELKGLEGFGKAVPTIFMAVAVFLLNVVLRRTVVVQREQIATLKALGYSNWKIGLHYVQWAAVIGVIGTAIGIFFGSLFGGLMMDMYNQFFRLPGLEFRLRPDVATGAVLAALAAAVLGARSAVMQAIRLQPAAAMRPAPPASYRQSLVERIGLKRFFSQPARIVFRNIERQPGRSIVTIGGVAASLAILIVGLFPIDSVDLLMRTQFWFVQRQDVTITFVEPVSAGGIHEMRRLPGVIAAEPVRDVPVRVYSRHRSRQLSLKGVPAEPALMRVVDVESLAPVTLPPDGLVISTKLAEVLDVGPGDTLRVETLIGRRTVKDIEVMRTVNEYMGMSAYMEINAVRRLVGEGGTFSSGHLLVDSDAFPDLFRAVKETPVIAGSTLKLAAWESFQKTFAENINISIFFNTLFASVIAFGVVYNAARVSLAERSRELASLRVMGFTRVEISRILLGELGLLTLLAIPLGVAGGYILSMVVVQLFSTELYVLPFAAGPEVYVASILAIVFASVVSGLIVRQKLDHLDLLEVLKAKE